MEEAQQPSDEDRLDRVVEDAYANSVWELPGVELEPSVQTLRWTVRQLPSGNRHLCAWIGDYGRVSSAITKWEPRDKVLVTSSGRRYSIDSPVGTHPDAEYIWDMWCPVQGFQPSDYVDVSHEYLSD